MVRSVLIVDDEPNIVRSLQFLMTKAGYDVRVARDGEQALDEIAKTQPDLVLLDVMMPKRDGFDVCQTIRANPRWAGVRVIMLTAKGRDIDGQSLARLEHQHPRHQRGQKSAGLESRARLER